MAKFFIKNFISGVFTIVPLALTIYLLNFVVSTADGWVGKIVPVELDHRIPGFGLLVIFLYIVLVGLLSRAVIIKYILNLLGKVIYKIPVLGMVYKSTEQVFSTFSGKETSLKGACLVQFPQKGVWSIAFTTGTAKGEVQKVTKSNMINVYVPTTPNPTSGYLLFMPEEDIKPLNMSADDALKLIISGGIVTPDGYDDDEKQPKLPV